MPRSINQTATLVTAAIWALVMSATFANAQGSQPSAQTSTVPLAASQPTSSETAKLRSENFVQVSDASTFPEACKTAFATLTREPAFALANPKQPFQATDLIAPGPKLPWRRLILGGASTDRCIIYYEKGGFAPGYEAVVLDISNVKAPTFVWGGTGGGDPHDMSALIALITQGAFKQGDRNTW